MESQPPFPERSHPIHSCLVLGCGRSGTSMVTGALAGAGYHLAEGLHQARRANPKGFFEAPAINDLNELLLARMLEPDSRFSGGQRWLAVPSEASTPVATADELAAMERLLASKPFCHKDPRFAFTLPAWRQALGDTRFVVVFRDPARTVRSLVEECREAPYLANVEFSEADAYALWEASYNAILEQSRQGGEWLFMHYDQVLTPAGLDRLSEFLGAEVDRDFPDRKLRRSEIAAVVPDTCEQLYRQLLEHARYQAPPRFERAEPLVAVATPLNDSDRAAWADSARELREQRGVRVELIVLDRTTIGFEDGEDVRSLPGTNDRGGADWIAAARSSEAPYLAWNEVRTRPLPAHLRSAVELLERRPECTAAIADTLSEDEHGQFVGQTQLASGAQLPLRHWHSGVVVRREALAGLPSDSSPEHWLRAQFEAGKIAICEEPGVTRTRSDAPPVARGARPVVAAWPRWDDPAELDRLMGLAAMLPTRTELRLRWDEERDPPRADALGALEASYQRCMREGRSLDVTLEEQPSLLSGGDASATSETPPAVNAILAMGDEPEDFLRRSSKHLGTPLDVRRWWHQLGL